MRMKVLLAIVLTAPIVGAAGLVRSADTAWLQWGGPRRNFTVDTGGLATTWPEGGPRRLWQRALGEGHSAVTVENGRLYTMYRSGQEKVVALDAARGTTLWEYSYAAPAGDLNFSEGAGPHSTPLIVGNLLFAASSRAQLFALDKASGKMVWSHDLWTEFKAPPDDRGYSPSPIAYRDTVIAPSGGAGASVVAFDQKSGALRWRAGDFPVGPGSPVLITVAGQDQLVISGKDAIVGVSPVDGATLWTHPHKTDWGLNISTPVWDAGTNTLFVTAAYNNGSRLLQLQQAGGKTAVKELWYQNRMRTHIGTVIRLGDYAIGSSGDFGPCPTVAIDLKTGAIVWQNREFARSTFLHADGKLVILDEDGTLGLATVSRDGLKVLVRASILSNRAWTVPTLVGTTLYVRDRKNMLALALGS